MRRPRPIQRLIDGPPGASGAAIARRLDLLLAPAVVLANLIGAACVLVLAIWVIPGPEIDDDELVLLNVAVGASYVVAFVVIGLLMTRRRLRAVREWLRAERPATVEERRIVLRGPITAVEPTLVGWGLAVVVFTVMNLAIEPEAAVVAGVTTLLGGLTTTGFASVLTARIIRPAARRALRDAPPERPRRFGITIRAASSWGLGSGIPLVGLVVVAIVVLARGDVSAEQLAITMLGLGGVAILAGLGLTVLTARLVAGSVESVRDAVRAVGTGELDVEVPIDDASELGVLQAGVNRMVAGLRERRELEDLFGRHVGEAVARRALDHGTHLGGETVPVAALFVDVIGSTTYAATHPPAQVVAQLNRFFAAVVEVVEGHGGYINKFAGDGGLAVFGAPVDEEDVPDRALAAARALPGRLREAVPELDAAIGLAYGDAVAGNVGAESRFEYTVLGDPVNAAARLCELAKDVPGRVLTTAATVAAAGEEERRRWTEGDEVTLRGRPEPTRLALPA